LIISFVFVSLTWRGVGQDILRFPFKKPVTSHFLEIGSGLNYFAVRDLETSPLTYKNCISSLHFQYFLVKGRFLGLWDENFSIGHLVTKNYPDNDHNKALVINNDMAIGAYFRYREHYRSKFYVGGELIATSNFRMNDKFNNANLNYEIMLSLAPSFMYEYKTSWKAGKINLGLFKLNKRDRNIMLQYHISIPVISDVLRPGYVSIYDFVDNESSTYSIKDSQLASFNTLFIIRNRFNFYYLLRNQNMLKLSYNLNYYNFHPDYNPVKGISTSLMFSVVFKFNSN
jgi:hypothetical protein